MKLSDRKTVEKLLAVRDKVVRAIAFHVDYVEALENERSDSGGVEGFERGFWCVLSSHGDGSGPGVDLTGCYVAEQMAEATGKILNDQLRAVNARLQELGVDVDR